MTRLSPDSDDQLSFAFSNHPTGADGIQAWRDEKRKELEETARKTGLPLGHPVTLTLSSGTALFGTLELDGATPPGTSKAIPLRIGPTRFTSAEIASCVRED